MMSKRLTKDEANKVVVGHLANAVSGKPQPQQSSTCPTCGKRDWKSQFDGSECAYCTGQIPEKKEAKPSEPTDNLEGLIQRVSRVAVIDHRTPDSPGIIIEEWDIPQVRLVLQDDGRTLKVLLTDGGKQ